MSDKLILPSTRSFAREARRLEGFSFLDWLHAYIYCRWPYKYIGTAIGERRMSPVLDHTAHFVRQIQRSFLTLKNRGKRNSSQSVRPRDKAADNYHGKVMTLEASEQLVSVRMNVRLENLEKVIPYRRAKDIILQNPNHILAVNCPCRSNRANPCRPLDVCLIVGEPFAGFIAEHHPLRSRWVDSAEVLDILRAEHERGHVHHAFFQEIMLGRFYGICNCCPCCCGAMQFYKKGVPMLAPSGYVCRPDSAMCNGCSKCVSHCPFDALSLVHEKVSLNKRLCMGCGLCVSKCRRKALSLERDLSKGDPLEILDLMADME